MLERGQHIIGERRIQIVRYHPEPTVDSQPPHGGPRARRDESGDLLPPAGDRYLLARRDALQQP
jgi:hypothetical protein